jgi:hypothetical protein
MRVLEVRSALTDRARRPAHFPARASSGVGEQRRDLVA